MTKSRKQRLRRIEDAFEVLWCALMDLRKCDMHTTDFHQLAGSKLNYLFALARKAK